MWSFTWSDPVDFAMGGTTVTAKNPFRSASEVGYESSLPLAWEVGFGETVNDLTWKRSYSQHEIYLTYKAEVPSYETVFHIGCTKANGKSQESQIVSSIWSAFSGLSVKRKGANTTMKYYGAYINTGFIFDTFGLLSNDDGRCGSWSDFLFDILNAQGITSIQRGIFVDSSTDGFLVNKWIFSAPTPSPPNANFPYRVYLYPPSPPLTEGVWTGTGINGQGPNSRPRSIFANHAVVQVGSMIYDPSYGVSYTANGWETTFKTFLAGFFKDVSGAIWATNSVTFPLILR